VGENIKLNVAEAAQVRAYITLVVRKCPTWDMDEIFDHIDGTVCESIFRSLPRRGQAWLTTTDNEEAAKQLLMAVIEEQEGL